MLAELTKGNAPAAVTVEALSAKTPRLSKDSPMNDTSQSDQIQALLKRQAALEAAVADMDSLAEQGLDEIRAVARVSLLALQASETHKFPLASFETLAQVLTMIAAKADDYRDLMMFHANGVGIESEQTYRVRARRKASMDALQSCEGVAA